MEALPDMIPHTSLVREMKTPKPETTIKNRDLIAAIEQVETQLKALTPQEFPYLDEEWLADPKADWDPIYEVGDTDPTIQASPNADLVGST
ncbi:MAG: hypothetical protein CL522_05260 [Actinobacteria bacterium]|nr:hypothetical protein [Actinomycetota bacterium]